MTTVFRRTVVLAACCVTACTVSDSSQAADSEAAIAPGTGAAPSTSPAVPVAPSTGTSATTSPSATRPARSVGTVAFDGVPPLRVGMSANDARRALGLPRQSTSKTGESCSYLDTRGKSHAFVMMENDTIVRFEARDRSLATEAGARVGDTEASVLDRYRGRVTVQPHKYLSGGHYLVVTTPADAKRRLVFETDGQLVTAFRVGRRLAVEYVEGCG